ncbi:hypothetical protein VTN77DRAFT_1341 [Rasamsonia byssochlamydoides]|uniref:uncharacterized protein n=1 Tax=Rasamsonia byssochlamydoides TaxID=89139 RepID=UPI0037441D8C
MPLPVIHRLQMSALKKAGVMVLFALGLFVCVASIIRMVSLVDSTTTKDRTWGSFSTLAWSSIEASVGLICTCIPHLRQPLKRLFPKARLLFSSSGQGRSSSPNQEYHLARMKCSMSRDTRSNVFRVASGRKTFQRSRTSEQEQTESLEDITQPHSPVKVDVCRREDGDED